MAWGEALYDIMLPPRTPALDQVRAHRQQADALGVFLDWLREQATYRDSSLASLPSTEQLLHAYFNIDPRQVDRERAELLAYQRLLNEYVDIRKELYLHDDE